MFTSHARRTGDVSRQPLKRAVRPVVEQLERRMLLANITPKIPAWVEQGPGPMLNATATVIPAQNNPIGGAAEAIATPPHNAAQVFVGTVNGGVWRTSNALDANPNWTWLRTSPQSVGAIAISRFDRFGNKISLSPPDLTKPLTDLVIYVGAARTSSAYNYGTWRSGVFKSTNGGNSWVALDPKLRGLNIESIVPAADDPNKLLVLNQA